MTTTARKQPPNFTLKRAIGGSSFYQKTIARRARIHEVRLSKIIRGRGIPTEKEKERLALVLHVPVSDLFPEVTL